MTTSKEWVERLALSTGYAQLAEAFARMAAEARASRDPVALAASIDEAIARMQRERARDEGELREVEDQYEAFKEKQGGVFGWLRRHVPFTETRQQEKAHQADLDDQAAEILADNLFIARAQVLKEAILPPGARRLGLDATDWERRLAADASVPRLRAYAEALATLARELPAGRAFVAEVRADLDAFAKARFAAEEDRRRQKADLAAAREELADFERGHESKEALRAQAVERLRALITEDVEARDPEYGAACRRAAKLEAAIGSAADLATRLDAARESAAAVAETAARLQAGDDERVALAREEGRLQAAVEAARRGRVAAEEVLAERSGPAEAAREEAERARAAASAARRAHDAHVVATGQVEVPAGRDFATSSPAAADLVRAQASLAAAEAVAREAVAADAAARRALEGARRAEQDAEEALEERRRKEETLAREARRLRDAAAAARATLHERIGETDALVASFVEATQDLGRRSALASPRDRARSPFELADEPLAPAGRTDAQAAQERLGRLAETARAEQAALQEDLRREQRETRAAWARRSHELLGGDLVAEIF